MVRPVTLHTASIVAAQTGGVSESFADEFFAERASLPREICSCNVTDRDALVVEVKRTYEVF